MLFQQHHAGGRAALCDRVSDHPTKAPRCSTGTPDERWQRRTVIAGRRLRQTGSEQRRKAREQQCCNESSGPDDDLLAGCNAKSSVRFPLRDRKSIFWGCSQSQLPARWWWDDLLRCAITEAHVAPDFVNAHHLRPICAGTRRYQVEADPADYEARVKSGRSRCCTGLIQTLPPLMPAVAARITLVTESSRDRRHRWPAGWLARCAVGRIRGQIND